jgi:hypothetical protein
VASTVPSAVSNWGVTVYVPTSVSTVPPSRAQGKLSATDEPPAGRFSESETVVAPTWAQLVGWPFALPSALSKIDHAIAAEPAGALASPQPAPAKQASETTKVHIIDLFTEHLSYLVFDFNLNLYGSYDPRRCASARSLECSSSWRASERRFPAQAQRIVERLSDEPPSVFASRNEPTAAKPPA